MQGLQQVLTCCRLALMSVWKFFAGSNYLVRAWSSHYLLHVGLDGSADSRQDQAVILVLRGFQHHVQLPRGHLVHADQHRCKVAPNLRSHRDQGLQGLVKE